MKQYLFFITYPFKKIKILLSRFNRQTTVFDFSRLVFWNRFFVLIYACIVWLCCMSLLGSYALEKVINPVKFSSKNKIVLEIYPENTSEKTQNKVDVVSNYLDTLNYISSYNIVPKEEVIDILNNFSGGFKEQFDNIPMPVVMTINIEEYNEDTILDLRVNLSKKVNNVYIDTERDLLSRLANPIDTAQNVGILIPLVSIVVLFGIIFLTIYAVLYSNRSTIEVLLFLGAYTKTIYREFSLWILRKSIQAFGLGFVCVIVSIFMLAYLFSFNFLDIVWGRYLLILFSALIISPLLSALITVFFVSRILIKGFVENIK